MNTNNKDTNKRRSLYSGIFNLIVGIPIIYIYVKFFLYETSKDSLNIMEILVFLFAALFPSLLIISGLILIIKGLKNNINKQGGGRGYDN